MLFNFHFMLLSYYFTLNRGVENKMLVKRRVDDRLQRVSYQAAYRADGDSRSNRGAERKKKKTHPL